VAYLLKEKLFEILISDKNFPFIFFIHRTHILWSDCIKHKSREYQSQKNWNGLWAQVFLEKVSDMG